MENFFNRQTRENTIDGQHHRFTTTIQESNWERRHKDRLPMKVLKLGLLTGNWLRGALEVHKGTARRFIDLPLQQRTFFVGISNLRPRRASTKLASPENASDGFRLIAWCANRRAGRNQFFAGAPDSGDRLRDAGGTVHQATTDRQMRKQVVRAFPGFGVFGNFPAIDRADSAAPPL